MPSIVAGTDGDDNQKRKSAGEAYDEPAQTAPGSGQKTVGRSHQAGRNQAKEGALEETPGRCERTARWAARRAVLNTERSRAVQYVRNTLFHGATLTLSSLSPNTSGGGFEEGLRLIFPH